MVLPIVIGLTKALAKVQTPYCTSVKSGLINSISHIYVQSDDHFVLSSVLEPRFRLKWTSSPAEEMAAKSIVTEHMDLLVEQTAAADQPTEQGITDCMFAQDELFSFVSSDDTSTRFHRQQA